MTSCSVPYYYMFVLMPAKVLVLVPVLEAQVLVLVLVLGHQVLVLVLESQVLDNNTDQRDMKACEKLLQFDVLTTLSQTILAYLHTFSCCCVRNLRNPEKFTEMKRNTWNWSNFCIRLSRTGFSASSGLSCKTRSSDAQSALTSHVAHGFVANRVWYIPTKYHYKKAQLTLSNPRDVKACKNCSNSTCFVSFHRIPFLRISKFRPRPIYSLKSGVCQL